MKKLSFKDTLQQLATDSELHTAAIYALSRLDQESLEAFKAIWPSIGIERRRSIVREMQEIAEVNFEVDFDPIFLLCLADDDAEVRATSVKSLWENENPALIRPLRRSRTTHSKG